MSCLADMFPNPGVAAQNIGDRFRNQPEAFGVRVPAISLVRQRPERFDGPKHPGVRSVDAHRHETQVRNVEPFPVTLATAVRIHVEDSPTVLECDGIRPDTIARPLIAVTAIVVQSHAVGDAVTQTGVVSRDVNGVRYRPSTCLDAKDHFHWSREARRYRR